MNIIKEQLELFNSSVPKNRTKTPTLRRFVDNLPSKPWVFRPDEQRVLVRPKQSAWQHESHVQCNLPWSTRYIVLDCDWEYERTFGLGNNQFYYLPPTFWLLNMQSGHFQAFFELAEPVWIDRSDREKQRAQRWLESITSRLELYYEADQSFSALTPRNPMHKATEFIFTAFARPRTLGEIQGLLDKHFPHVPDSPRRRELHTPNSDPDSWNRELFDRARTWAYGAVEHYTERDALKEDVRAYIESQSDAQAWLDTNTADIKSISKSVATFCIENRLNLSRAFEQKNRGVLGFGETRHNFNFDMPYLPPEEVKRRQQAGANYTNKLRSLDVENRIKASIAYLETIGKKVSQSAVATHSKVGIATVKRYWKTVR